MFDISILPESLPVREPNPYTDEQRICKKCGAEFTFKAKDQVKISTTGDYCSKGCRDEASREASHVALARGRKLKEMKRAGYL